MRSEKLLSPSARSVVVLNVVLIGIIAYQGLSRNFAHRDTAPNCKSVAACEALARRSPAFLSAQIPLSASALDYGERQIARMFKDRPNMRPYVAVSDPLYTYVTRMFAGAAAGTPVAWHNEPPIEATADHQYPTPNQPGFIRVNATYITGERKGAERPGEELWENALFELNNIRNARGFDKIYNEACAGRMNKQQFIEGMTRLEYKALQENEEVYETLWKPNMQARGITAPAGGWWGDVPPTYEEWIARYTDTKSYPWVPYGKYFDEKITPYVLACRKLRQM